MTAYCRWLIVFCVLSIGFVFNCRQLIGFLDKWFSIWVANKLFTMKMLSC